MTDEKQEKFYKVLKPLRIPNSPGKEPSSFKAKVGEIIAMDGNEPIRLDILLMTKAREEIVPPTTFGEVKKGKKKEIKDEYKFFKRFRI